MFWRITPRLHVNGMALFPFVLVRDRSLLESGDFVRHERIHLRQQLECGILPFYILYLGMYLINRLKGMSHYRAYRLILFEKEAFEHQSDRNYLRTRKWWAWARVGK